MIFVKGWRETDYLVKMGEQDFWVRDEGKWDIYLVRDEGKWLVCLELSSWFTNL